MNTEIKNMMLENQKIIHKKITEIHENCHYDFIIRNLDLNMNKSPANEKLKKIYNYCISSESSISHNFHSGNSQSIYKRLHEFNTNQTELLSAVNYLYDIYYEPIIFNKIYINIKCEHRINNSYPVHPLMTIGKLRENMKNHFHFTDINFVKMIYDNKILVNDSKNILSLNYKLKDVNNEMQYIYILINRPNDELNDSNLEVMAPSPAPAPLSSSTDSEIIQAEPINSNNEFISLKDRVLKLENTIESIVQHLDSAYEPE